MMFAKHSEINTAFTRMIPDLQNVQACNSNHWQDHVLLAGCREKSKYK